MTAFDTAWDLLKKEHWRETPIGRLISQSPMAYDMLDTTVSAKEMAMLAAMEEEERQKMAEYDAKMAYYQAFLDDYMGGEMPDQKDAFRLFNEAKPMRIQMGSVPLRMGMGEVGDLLTDRRMHPKRGVVFRPPSIEDFMRDKGVDPMGYKS
tara:strand:+ start:104 stop:556 length:453 start_codon:yes stop_codon:yes gene_type:complete